MKVKSFVLPLFFVLGLPFLLHLSSPRFAAAAPPPISPPNSSTMFIENVGQFDEHARFQVQGGSGTMWLAEDALWFTLLAPLTDAPTNRPDGWPDRSQPQERQPELGVNIRLSFVGANTTPLLEPFDRRETSINYFIGNKADQWYTDVPVWGGVRYAELYPGLDLELAGESGQLRPRLVCHENCQTALQQVNLQVEGAESLRLIEGQVALTTSIGNFVLPPLTIVMTDDTSPTTLTLSPHLDTNTVSFFASAPHHSLFASPASPDHFVGLLYATFLGGENLDRGWSIAVDTADNAYVVGLTYSFSFPTVPGIFDPIQSVREDAFVAKFNPLGSDLIYTTILGGDNFEYSQNIAIDGIGNAYVVGFTLSANFPTTPNAFDPTNNGEGDVFLVKLGPTGNELNYATYLGGDGDEYGESVVLDGTGHAYVAGYTYSVNFPTTPEAFDPTYNDSVDAYVVKFNPDGSDLVYATFLGGNDLDKGFSIAVDEIGNTYVTGRTYSDNFPTTPGAFDSSYNGELDAFAVKFNSVGSDLIYATFLGGTAGDAGYGIVIDGTGNAYITGETSSVNFPITPGAIDPTYNGGFHDAFALKLNPIGSEVVYATFLGGNLTDDGRSIVIDGMGNAYIIGTTFSANFPTTPDAFDPTFNGGSDVLVVKINAVGSGLIYATYLGGGSYDYGEGIALSDTGNVYITGLAGSANFPSTPGVFDPTYNGVEDAFVVKFESLYTPAHASFSGSPISGISPLNVSFTNLSTGDFDTCLWDFGDGATSPDCNAPNHTYETAGSYTVTLAISGLGGSDTVSQPAFITVYEPVQADFAAAPTSGHPPLLVQFTNLASGDFTNCLWDFGDGATSTECNNPVHIYEVLGTYTVMLTVSGSGGIATETKTDYIVVDPNLFFLPLLRSADE